MDVYLSNHFSFHYHVRIISWKLSFENTIELKISKANVKCLSNNRIYVRYLKSQSKKSTFRFKKEAYNYAKCKPTFLLEAVLYFELFLCAKKDLQIANIGKIVSQEENIFFYFRVIEG